MPPVNNVRKLFADDFVKGVIERSMANAAQAESEGNWSDSYAQCYWWLQEIDPNNVGYKAYTEELIDKIRIASSFEDSVCETSVERYKGIRPVIFEQAIRVLDLFYVSRIDYGQMAKDALGQCRLLTEVLAALPEKTFSETSLDLNERPSQDQLNAWNALLRTLVTEVEQGDHGAVESGISRDVRAGVGIESDHGQCTRTHPGGSIRPGLLCIVGSPYLSGMAQGDRGLQPGHEQRVHRHRCGDLQTPGPVDGR